MAQNTNAESIVHDIKRRKRKKYSSGEKIRIVLEGLRGEVSVMRDSKNRNSRNIPIAFRQRKILSIPSSVLIWL